MKGIKTNPVRTVLTISAGFTVIYLVTGYKEFLYFALAVATAGIFSDYLSRKIDFLWMKLAQLLSLVVPNILLSALYYLFLFPIALLSRLLGKSDPLHLKNKRESLFENSEQKFDKSFFEKPW